MGGRPGKFECRLLQKGKIKKAGSGVREIFRVPGRGKISL